MKHRLICLFWKWLFPFLISIFSYQNLFAQMAENLAIAYNVAVKDGTGKSNYEVFVINADGTNARNITQHPDVAWTYKAFGKTLYFISDRDTCHRCYFLYKTDINGTSPQKVSDLQLEDSWMDLRNSGSELIVSGRKGSLLRAQLFIINTSDGSYRQITNDTAALFRDPAFSPDGKNIAFIYRKNKRDRTLHDEVFVMSLDGKEIKQLTTYPPNELKNTENDNGYRAGALRWHPSGDFISYISRQGGINGIYAVTPDGSRQWKLIDSETHAGWHDWSPDGKWLVFDRSNRNETQYQIMLMQWPKGNPAQLTDDKHSYQQCPVFVER